MFCRTLLNPLGLSIAVKDFINSSIFSFENSGSFISFYFMLGCPATQHTSFVFKSMMSFIIIAFPSILNVLLDLFNLIFYDGDQVIPFVR
jgi:hypothetical protein